MDRNIVRVPTEKLEQLEQAIPTEKDIACELTVKQGKLTIYNDIHLIVLKTILEELKIND